MPSLDHEAPLHLFRNRPELAPELLRDALAIDVPAYTNIRIESGDLTDVAPAQYLADLVLLLTHQASVLAIVIEVQLRRDAHKRLVWPIYLGSVRKKFACPACVLVITPSDPVADWCRAPIEVGPGSTVCPLVIGPASVPIIDDVARAEDDPELAVLSVMAHGQEPHAEAIGRAALLATLKLEDERQLLYSDLVFAALSEAAKTALEELMASGNYEYQSDFAKKHQAAGRAEGRAEGESTGECKGLVRALLTLLQTRGLDLSTEHRALITACADVAQLETWIRKAAAARKTTLPVRTSPAATHLTETERGLLWAILHTPEDVAKVLQSLQEADLEGLASEQVLRKACELSWGCLLYTSPSPRD